MLRVKLYLVFRVRDPQRAFLSSVLPSAAQEPTETSRSALPLVVASSHAARRRRACQAWYLRETCPPPCSRRRSSTRLRSWRWASFRQRGEVLTPGLRGRSAARVASTSAGRLSLQRRALPAPPPAPSRSPDMATASVCDGKVNNNASRTQTPCGCCCCCCGCCLCCLRCGCCGGGLLWFFQRWLTKGLDAYRQRPTNELARTVHLMIYPKNGPSN